jgi:hypothetical protein
VRSAWEAFFDGKTPAAKKQQLLQNGQEFSSLIESQAGSSLAQSISATVSNVVVNGSTATVTYTIALGGTPALTDQQGTAVLESGQWKVSDSSFCQLLGLEALQNGGSPLPSACPAPTQSGSANPSM